MNRGFEAASLDGFTGDQRFFLGIGQAWRFKATDEAIRNRVQTDPHSPPEFRVNGPVANMPEFHAAFNVQEGDALYLPPEERVKIWEETTTESTLSRSARFRRPGPGRGPGSRS